MGVMRFAEARDAKGPAQALQLEESWCVQDFGATCALTGPSAGALPAPPIHIYMREAVRPPGMSAEYVRGVVQRFKSGSFI